MKKTLLISIFFISFYTQLFSQNIDTLIFCDYKTIPLHYRFQNTQVEEISGIDCAGIPGKYFLLPQSDFAPHYFLFTIEEHNNQISWYIDSVISIKAKDFDGESIRLNKKTNEIFLSEELKKQSFLKKINPDGSLQTVLKSDSSQKFNRGWEGTDFDKNCENIFISLEQSYTKPITHILKYHIASGKIDTLQYRLDILPDDTKNDNGITEILYVNDTTLLVLERDWQKSTKHTAVRVYKCKIDYSTKSVNKSKCLFNFDKLYFKPDNVEGMSFNADRTKIIFVTDDNKSKHQQTQIICFKIR